MSNPTTTRTPPAMVRGTLAYISDEARNLDLRALEKASQDPAKTPEQRARASEALERRQRVDGRLDRLEGLVGERAASALLWPARFTAGWLKAHPDVTDASLAQRANAYLAE